MCRLYNEILYTVVYSPLKCLINVIDLLAVSCQYVVDDDLGSESTSDRPVGIGSCNSLFN